MFGEYLNVSLDQTRQSLTMLKIKKKIKKKNEQKIKATGMGHFYLLNRERKLFFHYISVFLITEQTL